MAQMNIRMPSTPSTQFRSTTLSPRTSSHSDAAQQMISSPLMGPSRHHQHGYPQPTPSYEPAHLGTVPMVNTKVNSYSGPPPTRGQISPRMVSKSQMQLCSPSIGASQPQRFSVPGGAVELVMEAPKSSARFSAPGALAASALNATEEAGTFVAPPWASGQTSFSPPPVAQSGQTAGNGMWQQRQNTGVSPGQGPQRRNSGTAPRQFATNLSPRDREAKRSVGGSPGSYVAAKPETGAPSWDKENYENVNLNTRPLPNTMEKIGKKKAEIFQDSFMAYAQEGLLAQSQDRRETCNMQTEMEQLKGINNDLRTELQGVRDNMMRQSAKMAERDLYITKLEETQREERLQKKEVLETMERLQGDTKDKQGELQIMLEEHRQEKAANEKKFAEEKQVWHKEYNELQERYTSLEVQHSELHQRFHSFQRQQATSERSLTDKQAENCEKDSTISQLRKRLHEMECLMHDKDQSLQQQKHICQQQVLEKEQIIQQLSHESEKQDQAYQQLKHEHSKQDQAYQQLKHDYSKQDSRAIKQRMQEQHLKLRDFETQLRRVSCQGRAPGEVWRDVASFANKNFYGEEHARLFRQKTDLEDECRLMRKEVEIFRQRLVPEVCNSIRREAAAAVAATVAAADSGEASSLQPFQEPSP